MRFHRGLSESWLGGLDHANNFNIEFHRHRFARQFRRPLSHQVIVGGQHVRAHDVKEIRNSHALVERAHACWRRSIYVSWNISIPPKARVGPTETHDWYRLDAPEVADITL